jgi:hypothetical protein
MEANVGPWTQEVLGRPMTGDEFLASPEAQDAVFDAKFGQYVQKYGPEGAARAWLGGPGNINNPGAKDVFGTTVGSYGRKFMNAMGGAGAAPAAPGGGMPSMPVLMAAKDNPFLSPGQSAVVDALIQQTLGAQDPMRQLQMQKLRQDIDQPNLINAGALDFSDLSSFRKEIQGLPSYKNAAQAAPIYKSMVATFPNKTRASDLNLVYGLGKIMDPGSVVREGEMLMVKDTASLPDWLLGEINRLNGGQALQENTRRAILVEAKSRMDAYMQQWEADADQYRGIAARYGINEADAIPTFSDLPDLPAMSAEPTGAAAPPEAIQELRADPSPAAQREFDEVFGPGAAQRALRTSSPGMTGGGF